MKHLGEIKISNRGTGLVIEIEGIIGVPEWWQFDSEDERISTYEKFRSAVEQIKNTKAEQVTVNIRSIGGDVNDALMIYEALCGLDAEVTTCCHGYVASAATIVAQAASRGCRLLSSSSLYLVHNSMTTVEGNSRDAVRTAEMLGKTDERIAQLYATRSGRPVEYYRELMNRDGGHGEWLSPQEAVEHGLADRISEVSPLQSVRRKVRDFFERSGQTVSNAVMRLFDEPPAVSALPPAEAENLSNRIAFLEEKIEDLSRENIRLRTRPSATLAKEDPDTEPVLGYTSRPDNRLAYDFDVRQFRPGN